MNIWKPIAIIVSILFVAETMFIYYAMVEGTELTNKENQCIFEVCENAGYHSYIYDEGLCQCYKNGELVKEEYIP